MKKLIPMTDFVLEQEFTIEVQSLNNQWASRVSRYNKTMSYAKFIKQPLELWMFVPCDKDGNVLEEPEYFKIENSNLQTISWSDYVEEYQQAKERCLFDGFEFTKSQKFSMENKIKNSVHWYTQERLYLTAKKADGYHAYYQLFTVEDLIQCDLQLTQTAINQIGL